MDPLENFKFRVMWDGRYIAGVSKVSALRRLTEVMQRRSGGEPSVMHESPGHTTYEAITLERGITNDTAFEQWANLVNAPGGPGVINFRKDIILDMFDEAGRKVLSYKIYHCWISEYQAVPDLDANANAVAVEHIKLENEGWERDTSVVWPPQ
jgi:phage tail-like protein